MIKDEQTELAETSAIAISHTAVLAALVKLLQEKNLLSAEDVNDLYHHAMTSLEVAEPTNPTLLRRARLELDRTARNLADGPKRPR